MDSVINELLKTYTEVSTPENIALAKKIVDRSILANLNGNGLLVRDKTDWKVFIKTEHSYPMAFVMINDVVGFPIRNFSETKGVEETDAETLEIVESILTTHIEDFEITFFEVRNEPLIDIYGFKRPDDFILGEPKIISVTRDQLGPFVPDWNVTYTVDGMTEPQVFQVSWYEVKDHLERHSLTKFKKKFYIEE